MKSPRIIVSEYFVDNFIFKRLIELPCLYTSKWFQVPQTLIILFNINHLFAHG